MFWTTARWLLRLVLAGAVTFVIFAFCCRISVWRVGPPETGRAAGLAREGGQLHVVPTSTAREGIAGSRAGGGEEPATAVIPSIVSGCFVGWLAFILVPLPSHNKRSEWEYSAGTLVVVLLLGLVFGPLFTILQMGGG